jgi:lipopolysaccharide cholinephosphotransferase
MVRPWFVFASIVTIFVVCIFIFSRPKKVEGTDFTLSRELANHQKELKDIFTSFATFADAHSIVYWISDGTLLGSIRHNDIIPWDDDVDIQAPSTSVNKLRLLNKELEDVNLYFTFIDHIWRIKSIDPNIKAYIDVFEMVLDSDRWVYADSFNTNRWPNGYIYDNEVHPIMNYHFSNLIVPGPNNGEPYLERMYGKEWKTPIKWKGHFD